MSDLSSLLLLTCATCTSTAPNLAHTETPPCPQTQGQSQGDRVVAGATTCISPPEAILVALTPDFSERETRPERTRQPARSTPRPTSPELLTDWSVGAASSKTSSSPLTLPLQAGNQGEAVTRLQKKLKELGYYPGKVDGIYGQITKAAVTKFQQEQGLSTDGIVGSKTWSKLQTPPPPPEPVLEREDEPETDKSQDGETLGPPLEQNETKAPLHLVPLQILTSKPEYLWFLGWAVVFTGGLVLILKNCVNDLEGYKIVKGSVKGKKFAAVAQGDIGKSQNTNLTVASSTVAKLAAINVVTEPPKPLHFSETPERSSLVLQTRSHEPLENTNPKEEAKVPAISQELNRQEQLVASWANGGLVEPLKGLFTDLTPTKTSPQQPNNSNPPKANDTVGPHVAENNAAGTLIASLPLSNFATGDIYTYALVDDAQGRFILRGNELRVADRVLQNVQTNTNHTITVRCTNVRGFSVDKSLTITL